MTRTRIQAFGQRGSGVRQPRETRALGREWITVVSGIPRSGTSMAMQMLEAGGLPVLSDGFRQPDESNPNGYYELERVKSLARRRDWLAQSQGSAIKVIHILLRSLPVTFSYRVIVMRRALSQVVASQRAMLRRLGKPGSALDDDRLAQALSGQLQEAEAWLDRQSCMNVYCCRYEEVLREPLAAARRIDSFLGGGLNITKMAAAVRTDLCRHWRRGER